MKRLGKQCFWATTMLACLAIQVVHSQTCTKHADVVIVGGGPAGFVLANRLSSNPALTILLLEAGPDSTGNANVSTPVFATNTDGTQFTWNYTSAPEPALGGRTPALWQGHALGGGTAVNYMQYCRGAPSVFAEWARISGDAGWAWESFLPYFKRMSRRVLSNETYAPVTNASVYGDGQLVLSYDKEPDTFSPYVMSLFGQQGVEEVDFNAGHGIGRAYTTKTIRQSNATRETSLIAFGFPAAGRPNLEIQPNSWVTKVNFVGKKARSVTYISKSTATTVCAKEIILSAGGINTPKLLMLSGVGPADHLTSLGIPVIEANPDVGSHYFDHHLTVVEWNVSSAIITSSAYSNATYFQEIFREYVDQASGPLAVPATSAAVAIRVPDEVLRVANATYQLGLPRDRPHILYQCGPFPLSPIPFPDANIVGCLVALVAPEASGSVRLKSADYRDDPLVRSNYFGSPGDKASILWAVKHLRKLVSSLPVVLNELVPGPNVTTDAQIWEAIGASAGDFYHVVGTASMGMVVDRQFRVKGISGVRVVDSSVIPVIPSCYTQAHTYALAERAADILDKDGSFLEE